VLAFLSPIKQTHRAAGIRNSCRPRVSRSAKRRCPATSFAAPARLTRSQGSQTSGASQQGPLMVDNTRMSNSGMM